MKHLTSSNLLKFGTAVTAFALSLAAYAQFTDSTTSGGSASAAQDSAGPVRLARFSWIEGDVTWRPSEDAAWCGAGVNLPFRQGAQIWLSNGSRAEVQFDDGTVLRLGNGALVSFVTMYSDSNGEFTEMRLSSGLASIKPQNSMSMYQIDTSLASVKAYGPAWVRVSCESNVEISDRSGQAHVEGGQGELDMNAGDYLSVYDSTSAFQVQPLPPSDEWDQFCEKRDASMFGPSQNLPPNLAVCAGNLNQYGVWRYFAGYGQVWRPYNTAPGWRPYHEGHFVWVDPFGWTWCSDEPWGWAPYHYGTWVNVNGLWGWVPGPQTQYWSPAVVSFSSYGGNVAWAPLAPAEVHYPATLSIGFASGNWALSFSIGGCANYYPAVGGGYCEPRPWNNTVINRTNITNVTNVTNITNTTVNNTYVTNNFYPRNGPVGGSMTTMSGFTGGEHPTRIGTTTSTIFRHGAIAPASGVGAAPAGLPGVRPTAASFSPSRKVVDVAPPTSLLHKTVFRAPVPPHIARQSSLQEGFKPTVHKVGTGIGKQSTGQSTQPAGQGGVNNKYNRFNNQSKSGFNNTGQSNSGNTSHVGSTNTGASNTGVGKGQANTGAKPFHPATGNTGSHPTTGTGHPPVHPTGHFNTGTSKNHQNSSSQSKAKNNGKKPNKPADKPKTPPDKPKGGNG